ncbi:hypothetical protein BpHYR1_033315 [Brachionus plicatilis]|uniref:Uncharacterized protein n=1 Tax=Brachionus plicatilis TaxID=10195 RepID=A0A3M7SJW4_BRAPC|nr:hypothetical protein BpHYR1_033315 [Brachionus plicatilis]
MELNFQIKISKFFNSIHESHKREKQFSSILDIFLVYSRCILEYISEKKYTIEFFYDLFFIHPKTVNKKVCSKLLLNTGDLNKLKNFVRKLEEDRSIAIHSDP